VQKVETLENLAAPRLEYFQVDLLETTQIPFFVKGRFRKTNKQTKDTTKVLANITSVSNCISRSVTTSRKNAFGIRVYNTSIIYNCNVGVKYTFNNKEYAGNLTIETTDMQYSVGSNINIYVKNNEPSRFYFSQEVNKKRSSGTSCLLIGSILLVLTIVHIVLLQKSTTYKQLVCIDNLF